MPFELFGKGSPCPICGSNDKRCKTNDEGLVLCMNSTGKEFTPPGFVWRGMSDGGVWGMFAPGDSDRDAAARQAWTAQVEDRRRAREAADRHRRTVAMPSELRDRYYREILASLTLHPHDEGDLRRRNVPVHEIERRLFRSVTAGQPLDREYPLELPGIASGGHSLLVKGRGYLCPVFDASERIVALQVRLRDGNDGRYRWLSSNSSHRLHGNDEVPLAHYLGGQRPWLAFTEGVGVKPMLAHLRMQCRVIGAAGGQFQNSETQVQGAILANPGCTPVLFPDAGAIVNEQVMRHYTELAVMVDDLHVLWWGQFNKSDGDIDEVQRDRLRRARLITWAEFLELQGRIPAFSIGATTYDVAKSLPKAQASQELAEVPEGASEEEQLRTAIANYNALVDCGNRFQIIPYRNNLCRTWKLSKSDVEALSNELRRGQSGDPIQAGYVAGDVWSEMEQRLGHENEILGLPTGLYDLDEVTQGLQRSDLIVMAGRPGMGKTALAVQIAQHVAKSGTVVVFSLEMDRSQLVYRLLSNATGLPASHLKAGRIPAHAWAPITDCIGQLSESGLYLDDSPAITVEEMRIKLRPLATQQPIDCVVVDYIQLMGGDSENRVQELAAITRGLKALAKEFNCPVIALSQLSRGVESRADKRPISSDLRDSGGIEQDADLILMLYRDEYYNPDTTDLPGICELIITKHRNGPTGTVKVLFDAECTAFKSVYHG